MADFSTGMGLKNEIFKVSPSQFEPLALDIFKFQYSHNLLYKAYCDALHINVDNIQSIDTIPFLPIQFFKSKDVVSTSFTPEAIFESSGTTGSSNSKHLIKDLSIYKESFMKTFERFYGNANEWCIIGLLPSYLERKNSSLVHMVDHLIKESKHPSSGFYLYDFEKLHATLLENEKNKQPTLLIGVSYALLDFSEQFPMQLKNTLVMETGGMKGRSKEISKQALHEQLSKNLDTLNIHSEYGMTELLSQAYSKENRLFNCPPWMKILLRAEDDPLEILIHNNNPLIGDVNVIDLANVYSCSFIATDDRGKLYPDESFEILGRLENADIRGCGLMVI